MPPAYATFAAQNKPVFVTGMTGTGKTVTVQNLLSSLEPAEEDGGQNVVPMTVNFSAQTSSLVTQVRAPRGTICPAGRETFKAWWGGASKRGETI